MAPKFEANGEDEIGWQIQNSYSELPQVLFDPAKPAEVRAPRILIFNERLGSDLGLNLAALPRDVVAAIFSGGRLPTGAKPIAQAYAGHQFGHFTLLGDGRAILLGEQRTPSGRLVDIQLKGAGRTRYSRGGDGRAAIGPMLREYIVSEAMFALGIPTTRSLAVVATGESVFRNRTLPGAILTRVAASHIRVGTFEFLSAMQDRTALQALADYAIERHYPELVGDPRRYLEFFRAVMDRQASLIARWQLVGFIHGVMNTDNMAISGETIDYGPCAFMNAYRTDTVFSSIDHAGRYSYGNQPAVAQWNLSRFGHAVLPLIDSEIETAAAMATEVLQEFPAVFARYWLRGMRQKLGLVTEEVGDTQLIHALCAWMENSEADWTNTFRDLSCGKDLSTEGYRAPEFKAWHTQWRRRLAHESRAEALACELMCQVNPAVIPRNHQVEAALTAAEDRDDLSVLHRLLSVLSTPYESTVTSLPFQTPPAGDCGYKTFCGT